MVAAFSGKTFTFMCCISNVFLSNLPQQDRVKATIKDTTTTTARTTEAMGTDTTRAIMATLVMTILDTTIQIMDMDKAMMNTMVS